jgi:Zn-dependent protease
MDLNLIQKIAVFALPVVFAITLHEAAHGYVARYFGDNTAYMLGRVSLNPLRHIDPVGTILIPLISLVLGGILFGWAKPVPVNFSALKRPKQDMLWVAAAGPAANLLMILLWALVAKLAALMPGSSYALPLALMAEAGLYINAILMVLNLLPLPPLDGGRIAVSLLPNPWSYRFAQIERYGFPILVLLLFTGVLNYIMGPFIRGTMSAVGRVFGI